MVGLTERQNRATYILARYGTFVGFIILVIVMSILSPHFLNLGNLSTLLTQVSMLFIVAVGVTIVLISGNIDVSTGAIVGMSGIITAFLLTRGYSTFTAISVSLFMGLIFGAINGFVVGYLKVNSLIATFATSVIALGVNFWVGGGTTIMLLGDAAREEFLAIGWQGHTLGIPVPAIIMLIVLALGLMLTEKTPWGLRLYAVGGNPKAAKLFGIKLERMSLQAFMLSGLLAALSGIVVAARLGSGSPIAGQNYTLNAIAAGFIGATMFRHGEPHLLGTFFGVLIFGVITNGLSLLGIGYEIQSIARGLIVILAVTLAAGRS